MSNRKTRLRNQRNTVVIVLSIVALILLTASFFIGNDGARDLVRLMGYGLMLVTILFRVFKGEVGYKPTREEMEERMFGKEK